MKKGLVLTLLITATQILPAQKNDPCYAGVYLGKQDFLNNNLSYKIDKNVKGNKLDFSTPADMTLLLKIETQDSIVKFRPGEIYGYHDCGKSYRYSPGTELNAQRDYYKILETRGLVIYSSLFLSGSEIFYSVDLGSPIHRLTVKNLENDFSAQSRFLASVRELNKKGKDGLTTLRKDGSFEINKIYSETVSR